MQKKKTTQAQKQPEKQNDKYPAIDDFFTQFLDKKKKNYTKKLEKIDQLQKKNFDELTPEQKDLVNNRQKVVEDAIYYDEIKQLYFQASSKKEGQKQSNGNSANSNHATLNLYYLAKCVKEQGETALRVISGQGVEFQEKVHNYHHRIFQQDGSSSDTLKNAVNGLNIYLQDEAFVSQVEDIWSEGKLNQKHGNKAGQKDVRKESTNKPQLFAMSSDEEDEDQQDESPKRTEHKNQDAEHHVVKPNFVPLPEDDNEENFAFESGQQARGERRGRKPRGDRPYRKYDSDRRGERRDRGDRGEGREDKVQVEGEQDNKEEGDEVNREEKPRQRGKPSRGRDFAHDMNRDSGERRKPFGRGRGTGKHYNKEHRDDNTYQKKEAKVDKQED